MAGPATLAVAHGGPLAQIVPVMAAGEMFADKTEMIGSRLDPVPLAGRALMGGLVGALIAHEADGHVLIGAAIGAATAVAAAHLAFHARTRLPNVAGGLLEDVLVVAIGSRYASAIR
ncbi:MAG: hypothetical protein M3R55_17720, partial [Acidobacteriota bacterium]|nr:hypothetical protein [Acidobacteriota bacterium]